LLQYKPAAVKKMPSAVSAPPPSSSSRLPQPSGVSKAVVGMKCMLAILYFFSEYYFSGYVVKVVK